MKTLNLKEMEVIEGGVRFWGSEDNVIDADPDSSCPSGWRNNVYNNYYILGIRVSHEQVASGPCVGGVE